jgi:hypothetical protein
VAVRWERLLALKGRRGLVLPGPEERRAVEQLAVSVLGLSPADAARDWGEAIGYGLYSVAVLRPDPGVRHPFADACADVALKVFTNSAHVAVEFQKRCLVGRRLPRVQRTLAAGQQADGARRVRGYLVLEYVAGPTLEEALEAGQLHDPGQRLDVLGSLLGDLLIPLWAEGLRLWDFRPANLVLSPAPRLTLIDTDSLRGAMLERDETPDCWDVRSRWEDIALGKPGRTGGRLEQVMVLLDQREGEKPLAVRKRLARALAGSGLAEALRELGRQSDVEGRLQVREQAEHSLDAFVASLRAPAR